MNKKTAFTLVIILLIAAVGALWWQNKNAVKAYEFVGSVDKVEGSEMTMTGLFVVDNRPDLASDKNKKTVKVSVSGQTKITKETVYLPKPEDIKDPNGTFKVDDLKKVATEVSMGDLQLDLNASQMSLRVKSEKNIYGKSKFIASEISYRVSVLPLDQK